ncbi:MAG: hypothetical protein ACRYGK_12855, partial [Janthinobacterium lividum]
MRNRPALDDAPCRASDGAALAEMSASAASAAAMEKTLHMPRLFARDPHPAPLLPSLPLPPSLPLLPLPPLQLRLQQLHKQAVQQEASKLAIVTHTGGACGSGLSRRDTKRRRQLKKLSAAVSGFEHLEFPAIAPRTAPYWSKQAMLVSSVTQSCNWKTLKLQLDNLPSGRLALKARHVLKAIRHGHGAAGQIALAFKGCAFNGADAHAYARFANRIANRRHRVSTLVLNAVHLDAPAAKTMIESFSIGSSETLSLCDVVFEDTPNLLHSLLRNTQLQMLTLERCSMDRHDASDLATLLFNHPALNGLVLRQMYAETGWLAPVCKAMASNTRISLLDLAGNRFDGAALDDLCLALAGNAALIELDLADGQIDNPGTFAITLGAALAINQTLAILNLSGILFDNDALTALFQGLANNRSIET